MDRRRILLVVAVVVAALGAVLVFVYAQGADDRAKDDLAGQQVLVVTQQINPGESAADAFAAGKIVSEEVPSDDVLEGATDDTDAFTDEVALTTIYPREQMIDAKFGAIDEVQANTKLPTPAGKVAITVDLSSSGSLDSFTRPGSTVAVIFTGTPPNAAQPVSAVLVPKLLVLATGTTSLADAGDDPDADGEGVSDALPTTAISLAVSTKQANQIRLAESFGTLTFALINGDTKVKSGEAVDPATLFSE